jgi:4a-hydroxytetrahydrobiopterin dehydratase
MSELLSDEEVQERLAARPAWRAAGAAITAEFRAPDFRSAIALIDGVADAAEAVNHHPDINLRYDRVTFVLSTHSAGGLTEQDFALAGRIDELAGQHAAVPAGG